MQDKDCELQPTEYTEKRHVVIADDHPTISHALQRILVRIGGVETAEADSFDALKELMASTPTDLVLLDLEMPGTEGYSALTYLRRKYPKVPVAVVSGHVQPTIVRTAIELGATAYIPKTLKMRELVSALQTGMRRKTWTG